MHLRKGPEPKPDKGYAGKTERINLFERRVGNEDGKENRKTDGGNGESAE